MKRCYALVVLCSILFVAAIASTVSANYPIPDTTVTVKLQQGWFNGIVAWFICTDSSTVDFAKTTPITPDRPATLAPKLSSGFYGVGVAAMFIVTNPVASQGPVFETMPGQALYSGIWRVRFVTWKPGAMQVPLTSIGQILALKGVGQLDYVESPTRLDCPILGTGPLGGPWLKKPFPPYYRICQALGHNPYAKTLTLPAWYVYCQDRTTKRILVCTIIIPDVDSRTLASQIGANWAPMLKNFPSGDTQSIYVFRFPKPINQFPVIQECPNGEGWRNTNYAYSPVMKYNIVQRIPAIANVVINNSGYLESLLGGPLTNSSTGQRINAPVLSCMPLW